jgi:hypothetical protein
MAGSLVKAEEAERFREMLPLVAWLDSCRWQSSRNMNTGLLTVEKFKKLEGYGEKVLVHWLCYITDRMRDFEPVWELGGQIFSEIIEQYRNVENEQMLMKTIFSREGFMQRPENGKKIDPFVSKEKENEKKAPLAFGPRFQDDLLSIARTLYGLLLRYDGSITNYLEQNADFWTTGTDMAGRIAYLLYMLSYKDLHKEYYNFEQSNQSQFLSEAESYMKTLEKDPFPGYLEWCKSGRYGAKRLWAALRDYLKQGSGFRSDFVNAMNPDCRRALGNIDLFDLEFPGDVWNRRFLENLFQPIFGERVDRNGKQLVLRNNASESIRRIFEELVQGEDRSKYYPEQLDISFDFAPRMCDNKWEQFCLFQGNARDLCIYIQFQETSNERLAEKVCPVAVISGGYVIPCDSVNCPIPLATSRLCENGCRRGP